MSGLHIAFLVAGTLLMVSSLFVLGYDVASKEGPKSSMLYLTLGLYLSGMAFYLISTGFESDQVQIIQISITPIY